MDRQTNSQYYHRVKNYVFFANLVFNLVLLFIFLKGGFSVSLRGFCAQFSSQVFILNAVYLTVFAALIYILNFPFSLFEGFIWEHKFKLSNQKFVPWLADDVKKALVSFVILLVSVEVMYVFLRNFPHTWWIWAAVCENKDGATSRAPIRDQDAPFGPGAPC